MSSEIAGQLQTGRDLGERECFVEALGHARKLREAFLAFADHQANYRTAAAATVHLRGLRDSIRGIALLRNDTVWLRPVQVLDAVDRLLQQEFDRRARVAQLAVAMGGGEVPSLTKREDWIQRADVIAQMAWHIDDLFGRARKGQRDTTLVRRTPKGLLIH